MRIKFMTLLMLLIVACLSITGCVYEDSQTNNKDGEIENNKENISNDSSSNSDSPDETRIYAHSWQELKLLYDASKKDRDEDFLSELKSIDDQCYIEKAPHIFFDSQPEKAKSCLKMFDSIINYNLVVPKDELKTRIDHIVISSVYRGNLLRKRYGFVYEEQEYVFDIESGRDLREDIKRHEGDPIDVITGDGYTAKIWLFRTASGDYQAYSGYITLDGDEYPTVKVLLAYKGIRPDDISKELLPRFGEFDITTVEEILEGIDS